MIQQLNKMVAVVYEFMFLPVILDQVNSESADLCAICEVKLPVGREFLLPSAARMASVRLELKASLRPDDWRCKCEQPTHLAQDLVEVQSALTNEFWKIGEDFLDGIPLHGTVRLRDAKYDGILLSPCVVTFTLTLIDTTNSPANP